MEIQSIKSSLGKSKAGAQLTLADSAKPQCLVPFSFYISDVLAFEEKNKVKLNDLRFKPVVIMATAMAAEDFGSGIKIEGEIALDIGATKESK